MPRLIMSSVPSSKRIRMFLALRSTAAMRRCLSARLNDRGVVGGFRTSGQVTLTPVMMRPGTLRRRSRTMVSASGSSGIPGRLSPADIAAEILAFEFNGFRCFAAVRSGFGDGFAQPGNRHDTAAAGDDVAIDQFGARVEDDHPGAQRFRHRDALA